MRVFYRLFQQSTGITGLASNPRPRETLREIYKKTLVELTELPKHSVYRQATETLTKHRLDLTNKTEDIDALEQAIGEGIIEQVIEAAESELRLVPQMKKWAVWEDLEEAPPEGQWSYFDRKHKSSYSDKS